MVNINQHKIKPTRWLLDVLRRLRIAGFAFVAIMIIGTVGYSVIADGNVMDAFYMTAITLTTIGFHEIIDMSTSPGGRLFTVFIAFMGIGIFTYFLSNVAALFIEGDIRKTFYKRKMEKKISKMEDHYVICGSGRVGGNIASELYQTDRPFVIADLDESRLSALPAELKGRPMMAGDCTDDDFLMTLGVDRARGVFVTSGDDNTNLVICLTARQLNPTCRIVVKIIDLNHAAKVKRAGADRIISPNYIGGLRMASEMIRPSVTSFLDEMTRTSRQNFRIEEVEVSTNFSGKSLDELKTSDCKNTLILAVKSPDQCEYIPDPKQNLNAGDKLIMMTTPKERQLIEDRLS